MSLYTYPCAAEILRRLHSGEAEISYARDEGKGYTYITLKGTTNGYGCRATDSSRIASDDPNLVRTE